MRCAFVVRASGRERVGVRGGGGGDGRGDDAIGIRRDARRRETGR